ncbi:FkbM family methyltransferase [Roseibium denhamense]|uniref:Methyltransferase, FkbM family n=1 Tax=Roseibium denhamense TaxID=76305 RepID=A0ABY1PNN8_9HYPH|nr:FkbM family methyltransferase [Roseibium denhamense]MTI07010.1 FkbM family methyltransferase [Roseibium denhamense]SMP36577.1 methyltransferase, FkbM family [Roseibium denhamense]
MFDELLGNIKKTLRRRLKPNQITIDGIRVSTSLEHVTKDIRKALFREVYERPERLLTQKYLSRTDRVLEIGAGVGLISVTCARICGSENVLSYEPNPRTRIAIEKNFELNGLKPKLRNKAVGLTAEEVDFYFAENIFSSSVFDRNYGGKTTVECDAISDVISEFQPNAIIMDVEGAEIDLLGQTNLSNIDKLIVEMHPHIVGNDNVDFLLSSLKKKGFRLIETLSISYVFLR